MSKKVKEVVAEVAADVAPATEFVHLFEKGVFAFPDGSSYRGEFVRTVEINLPETDVAPEYDDDGNEIPRKPFDPIEEAKNG